MGKVVKKVIAPVLRIAAPILPFTPLAPLAPFAAIGAQITGGFASFGPTIPADIPGIPGIPSGVQDVLRLLLPGELGGVPGSAGTPQELIQATVVTAANLLKLTGVLDQSVGGRLERLAGSQQSLVDVAARLFLPESAAQSSALRGLLGSVVDLVFPELARGRAAQDDFIFRQFPGLGMSSRQTARAQYVRRDTVRLAAQRRWVPPEWAAQRGMHNPNFEDVDVPAPAEEVPLVLGEGFAEAGMMIHGMGYEGVTGALGQVGEAVVQALIRLLEPLMHAGIGVGGFVGNQVRELAIGTFGTIGEGILRSVTSSFDNAGPVGPGEQGRVVQLALGNAFTMGIGAHVLAATAELVMPLKHLGLPQLAAFMVDLAGFGAIAGAELRPLVKWGIDVPADYAARERFQSQRPGLGEAKQFVLERLITLDDYRQILRWHGYPDDWVEIFVKEVWEEPSLRELSTVVDDTPVDEEWLRQKVTETGLEDRDVDLFMEGLKRRANKSVRQAYLGTLQSAYRDGLLEEAELEGELGRLDLNEEARTLVRLRAALEKRRELTDLWERALRAKAESEVMTLDDYAMALRSVGIGDDRVQVLVAVADATLRGRFAREERADIKRVLREDQATRAQLARESFRRGRVTQDQLFRMLVSLGIEERQADAMVALEVVRVQPLPRLPVVLTPEAQRQQENEVIQEGALAALREGKVTEGVARRVLLSLDLPSRLVEALLTLELARLKAPKPVVVKEDPAAVQARQLKTEAAVQEFRTKKLTVEQLRPRLAAAGHPAAVVEGFVERELARVPLPKPPPAPAPPKEDPAERERRTILTQAARELFRQGVLDQEELVSLLRNLGHPAETADALATLEAIRAQGKSTGVR